MMNTYTFVTMEVSRKTYSEIEAKLKEVGYDHALHKLQSGKVALNMHGIALAKGNDDADS